MSTPASENAIPPFVHLRVHTEFSLTDSIVRVEPPKRKGGGAGPTLTVRLAQLGQPAAAVTDRSNIYALVKFYKSAEGSGIKPIGGADICVSTDPLSAQASPERLTLLVESPTGYARLCQLLSRAYAEGQGPHGPVVAWSWLEEPGTTDGLIALVGSDGCLGKALINGHLEAADTALDRLNAIFGPGDRLYLELTRCGRPEDAVHAAVASLYARARNVPVVATNDVRFIHREDFDAHEARVCIAEGRTLADPRRPRRTTEEQYLKSSEEMAELFADLPEALENTREIARRCTLTLSFGTYHLPDFPVPEGFTANTWLVQKAEEGLQARLDHLGVSADPAVYRERLAFEIATIHRMGFSGYFLVVADFIEWAKGNGCPVGPGRGSGAGSLVAFALGITDLDPLPFNLLFERFLNPDRVSMPDFDVDFCMDNRDRVIDYVAEKYGRPHVGQIITYATMAARGVIRDVCRILDHSWGFGNSIATLIPPIPGATLADAIEGNPELKRRYDTEEDVKAVLDLGLTLEGITRGVGKHAGGVVIAPKALVTYTALYCEPGGQGQMTQFDMKDLETLGLVKFDFLGLKTLTVIKGALEIIAERHGKDLDLLALKLDDAEAYRLYAEGKTGAIFQMESPGMQRASLDLKPDCFEDIVALVSLYRPGPMDLIPEYCARKRGDAPVIYLHPEMEEVLSATYGIFVYQEQVMQMSQRMAGYTLGGADLLRRAMGKKIASEMAQQRGVFTTGSTDRGIDPEIAGKVFDLMEKFANYGFNKSHAAAYALVSYHTAWLKAHYPAEFMASVMSCDLDDTEGVIVPMLDECRRMGLDVLPPDVNESFYKFTVPRDGVIRYGLGAVKGAGAAALEGLINERGTNGPFTGLFDFCRRIDLRKVNKRVLEALIFSGSMDSFGLNRPTLLKTLPRALQLAEKAATDIALGQDDLFGLGDGGTSPAPANAALTAPDFAPEWDLREKVERERETLGYYLSSHPIEAYREITDAVCTGRLPGLIAQYAKPRPDPLPEGKTVWQPRQKIMLAAWVSDIRFFRGDKNAVGRSAQASYKITFTDRVDIATWIDGDKWPRLQHSIEAGKICFIVAELGLSAPREGREPEPRLYNAEFLNLSEAIQRHLAGIQMVFRGPARRVGELHALLKTWLQPADALGGANLEIDAVLPGPGVRVSLDLPPEWRLKLTEDGLVKLRAAVAEDDLKLSWRRYTAPEVQRRFERKYAVVDDDE